MQVIRFGAVGVLNTLIDFAILNLLMTVFQAVSGGTLLLCNAVAFLVASLNSYLLNKKWTFGERGGGSLRQYMVFLTFSAGGLVINSVVLYLMTTAISRPSDFSPALWVNAAKVNATAASLIWNYLAYRFLVFRTASLQKG